MDGFPLDLIIFFAIAAFLILRLRNVLGRRTGQERPPPQPMAPKTAVKKQADDNVIALPDRADDEFDEATPLDAGLAQIGVADRRFDPEEFVVGARVAFEMVVTAFAKGDKDALRPLLSDEVYDNFTTAIDARESRGETLETTLVGIKGRGPMRARSHIHWAQD